MNKTIYTLTTLCIMLTMTVTHAKAQDISNFSFEQVGKTIQLHYNLNDNNYQGIYLVEVYLSQDNGQTWQGPLKAVTGHVGSNQKPGTNKTITWDVLQEKDKLTGNIKFKIKATGGSLSFTDPRDGKTYKTVKIGTQVWMAENLNYDAGSNCWCYDDNSSNCAKYGRLYTYETAKNVCPSGWHLPSKAEFKTLLNNVGGSGENAYIALKEGGSNSFNALFGGGRGGNGGYYDMGSYGYFWSSSERGSTEAWSMSIYSYGKEANLSYYHTRSWGFSVRCLKD